jgi:hypothetical protein
VTINAAISVRGMPLWLWWGGLLASFLFVSPAFADTVTIRTIGRAEGVDSVARAEALRNAQADAVLQLVYQLVPGSERRLPPALRAIVRRITRYAEQSDILRSDIVDDSVRVEADIHVDEKALRVDVAILMLPRLPKKPVVQLVVGEQIGKDTVPAVLTGSIAESRFLEGLKDFGLAPKGMEDIENTWEPGVLIDIVTGPVGKGVSFASRFDVDVVVLGTVTTETEQSDGNIPKIRAKANLRIHGGGDGRIIDDIFTTAAVRSPYAKDGGEQAVYDACTRALHQTAVAAVLAVLARGGEERVVLTVHHPDSRERIDALKSYLESLPGMDSVEERFFDGSRCRLVLHYAGDMAPLADWLRMERYIGAEFRIQKVVLREIDGAFSE